ncbi:MAG: ABC transporter permease [Patescibacteria group bacterium]|nr:ABC transporter permease [Patescibacteria group bacterium]
MKKFLVLVKKEVKELLTPQMILPLLAVILVFMFIGKVAGKEVAKTQAPQPVAVLDLDHSSWSGQIPEILSKANFQVTEYRSLNPDQALAQAKSSGENLLIVIPQNFGSQLQQGRPQQLQIYTMFRNFSVSSGKSAQLSQAVVSAVNEAFSSQLLSQVLPAGASAAEMKNPVQPAFVTVVGDKQAAVSPAAISGFISSQTTFIPIILFLVIVFASQLIAVSIATEKENKTLETLLSAPVSRNAIVSAKLVGAGLVALLTSVIYLFGMRYYINGLSGGAVSGAADAAIKTAAASLGLVFTPLDYVLLGLSLFFGILAALSIALILGSFTEDAKSAQGTIAPLMMLILVPYFLTMMLDINSLSPGLRALVYAIPFSHPFLAAPNLLLGQYRGVIYGILYMAALFAVFVFIASRIFASDKILTMRVKLKKN